MRRGGEMEPEFCVGGALWSGMEVPLFVYDVFFNNMMDHQEIIRWEYLF
jgi:hypothetical protein